MDPSQETVNQQALQKALDGGSLSLYAIMCEPGSVKEGAKGYILGNWNNHATEFCGWLESLDYVILWEDEWASCAECGGLVRTQPDCYFWKPFYILHEGDLLCGKCKLEMVRSLL